MAESSERTYFVLPGLEPIFPMSQEIAGRVREYAKNLEEMQHLKTNVNDVGTNNLVNLHVQKKNAEAAGNLQERGRLQIQIADQEGVLMRTHERAGWIEQFLRIEKRLLYHWVSLSDLVKKDPPPYAIHCTSLEQISAVHFLITQIATNWPADRVFRIAVGSNTTDGSSVQQLKDHAKLLNFEVVSLFSGMQ